VAADHDVLNHGHVEEQLQVLKRPGHAQGGDAVWRQAAEFMSVKPDGAGGGLVKATQGIEQGGFARAVGTDDGVNQAFGRLETDPGQGHDAAEALFQSFDDQQGRE